MTTQPKQLTVDRAYVCVDCAREYIYKIVPFMPAGAARCTCGGRMLPKQGR